jgi:predicted nucleic acid-binding protein
VNLIDSSAWLEYFAGGPQAQLVSSAIERIEQVLVPTIVITEVTRRVLRQRDEDAALQAAAALRQGHVAPLDDTIAVNAAHYGVELKLPLADSIILATAREFGATIWTFDADFAEVPGVRYFPRPKRR